MKQCRQELEDKIDRVKALEADNEHVVEKVRAVEWEWAATQLEIALGLVER